MEDIDLRSVILETNNSPFSRTTRSGLPMANGRWITRQSRTARPTKCGETNLVLFARGEIPSTSSGLRPPEPPELPTVRMRWFYMRVPDSTKRWSVTLQYSFDLNLWIDARRRPRDPAAWLITWDGVFDFRFFSGEVFHRFKVVYLWHFWRLIQLRQERRFELPSYKV